MNGLELSCIFLLTLVFYLHVKAEFIVNNEGKVRIVTDTELPDIKALLRERVPIVFRGTEVPLPLLVVKKKKVRVRKSKDICIEYASTHVIRAPKDKLSLKLYSPQSLIRGEVDGWLGSCKGKARGEAVLVELEVGQSLFVPSGWGVQMEGKSVGEKCLSYSIFTLIANRIRSLHIA